MFIHTFVEAIAHDIIRSQRMHCYELLDGGVTLSILSQSRTGVVLPHYDCCVEKFFSVCFSETTQFSFHESGRIFVFLGGIFMRNKEVSYAAMIMLCDKVFDTTEVSEIYLS